uniref:3-deoxy-8-phosphooctulonate synthase n=1 Tax=Kalanchoe fedtschenkoi TaxID=63787 RepID=A0A7N0U9A7_KALFE
MNIILCLVAVALHHQLKTAEPFFLPASPNVIESEEQVFKMARHLKAICVRVGVPLVFKSSFDKANRTSSASFHGPGLEQGLSDLEKVKAAYDLSIVTDVHESWQCEQVGRVADVVQIPQWCRSRRE